MSSRLTYESLSGSEEFKKILSGNKIQSKLFTIFYILKDKEDKASNIKVSCVAAKKLGNAVKRNRMRRRLKMAFRKSIETIGSRFNKNFKYAVFAKSKIYDEEFAKITDELTLKLKSI
jgi:ribonuclease P protein component